MFLNFLLGKIRVKVLMTEQYAAKRVLYFWRNAATCWKQIRLRKFE